MRVSKTGCHVQSELIVVVHILVCNLDEFASSLDDDLFFEDGVEHGVNLIFDGFNEDCVTFHEWELQSVLEIWIVQSEDAVILKEIRFSVLNPRNSLSLRINHKWVSSRSGDHDTVLDTEIIGWETLQIPFTNGGVVYQELGKF